MDKVTFKGMTFKARRFGFTPGSWIIGKRIAKKILAACENRKMPRVGYEVALFGPTPSLATDFRNCIINEAGRLRLNLIDHYECVRV